MSKQGSPEWHKQRATRITGTRIAPIIGCSPFSNAEDTMRAMVRAYHGKENEFEIKKEKDDHLRIALEYGIKNEPMAIMAFELFAEKNGLILEVEEAEFVVHPEYDWIGASPDGFVGENALIEIKCPYSKRNAESFKSYVEQPHYYAQMQMQLQCTGRDECFFFQWNDKTNLCERVERNDNWWKQQLPKLQEFYDKFLEEVKTPERHFEPVVQVLDDKALYERYVAAQAANRATGDTLNAIKAEIIELAGGKKSSLNDVLIYPTTRKTVDYKKLISDNKLDTSGYEKTAKTSWTVRGK